MQIFTKLSNRFKYSKRMKSQTSAQTRLTAKTIYAVPGNSVIIDASLADKLTLYWGEFSHCATRTPGSVTAIAIVPTSLHPIYRASRLQDVKRHVACADQSPSRMDEGDLNAVILVNRHDRKRPHRLAITSINQRLGSRCQALRDMTLIQRMQVIILSISDRHHHRRVPQRQSAPLFITQPWPIAIGFQSIVRQLGEYEW